MSKFDIESLIGQRVEVYRDLNQGHLCWSLRSPTTKLVLNYAAAGDERIKVKTQEVAGRTVEEPGRTVEEPGQWKNRVREQLLLILANIAL